MKPVGWPRYLVEKPLKGGGTAYYWRPQARDIQHGFSIPGEALGTDYAAACERAGLLNQHLDGWRQGRGAAKEHDRRTTQPASRSDAYALHAALVAAGEPDLAAVPLICFEWHQRPENVLAGHLTWGDYRPPERPDAARIVQHKTDELVSLPLADASGPLSPELTPT